MKTKLAVQRTAERTINEKYAVARGGELSEFSIFEYGEGRYQRGDNCKPLPSTCIGVE
jgi:hypothetical protein